MLQLIFIAFIFFCIIKVLSSTRKPTKKMVDYARDISYKRNVPIPKGTLDSFKKTRRFLNQHGQPLIR